MDYPSKKSFTNKPTLKGLSLSAIKDIFFPRSCIQCSDLVEEPQTTLSRELRKKNIRKAFVLSPNIKLDFKKKYILVNDVFTTGSTANACAKVLKKQAYTQSNLSHLDTDKCCFN